MFLLALSRRKKTIENGIKHLQEAGKPGSDYEKYLKERRELQDKFAKKNKKDKPEVQSNFIQGQEVKVPIIDPEKEKQYRKELAELKKKHKEAIDEYEKQKEDYEKLLEKKADIIIPEYIKSDIHPKATLGDVILLKSIFKIKDQGKSKINMRRGDIVGMVGDNKDKPMRDRIFEACGRLRGEELITTMLLNYKVFDDLFEKFQDDKPLKDYKEKHVDVRQKTLEELAEKDANDEPVIKRTPQGGFVFDFKDTKKLEESVNNLISENEKIIKDYEKYLNEDIEVAIVPISEEELKEKDESEMTVQATDILINFIQ